MSILNETVKQFKNIIAIDTAKNSFQVCVARTDGEGKPKHTSSPGLSSRKALSSLVVKTL